MLLADKQVGYTVAHMATDLRLALIRALLRSRWQYYVHQPIGTYATAVASEARRASEAYLRAHDARGAVHPGGSVRRGRLAGVVAGDARRRSLVTAVIVDRAQSPGARGAARRRAPDHGWGARC